LRIAPSFSISEFGLKIMIAHAKPAGKGTVSFVYELKITLNYVKPAVWRRLRVPGSANLGWLHAVIQVAMGWTNIHLHRFEAGGWTYADPLSELGTPEDNPPVADEHGATLQSIAPRLKDQLIYEYDFGDSWLHQIVVEKIMPAAPGAGLIAQCLDGARACPPDDCGGPPGYDDLVRILGNPKHKEHKSMKEWLGRPFDPDAFDPIKIDKYLGKLKWPHVTESQLRRVLMTRDGAAK
jgi:hypothetical protein